MLCNINRHPSIPITCVLGILPLAFYMVLVWDKDKIGRVHTDIEHYEIQLKSYIEYFGQSIICQASQYFFFCIYLCCFVNKLLIHCLKFVHNSNTSHENGNDINFLRQVTIFSKVLLSSKNSHAQAIQRRTKNSTVCCLLLNVSKNYHTHVVIFLIFPLQQSAKDTGVMF